MSKVTRSILFKPFPRAQCTLLWFRRSALACIFGILLLNWVRRNFSNSWENAVAPPGKQGTVQILAFYFPQFHEFRENNEFWGKGFSDFTNVAKATRNTAGFMKGYPVIHPLDGYYNLLDVDVRKKQARLASSFGIDGFVIMHYWFEGKPVMEQPLEMILLDGEPNIQFCFEWANEHWTKRWDGGENEILLKQTYVRSDWLLHFEWLSRFFGLDNYIKVNNRPMILLYRASEIPELGSMLIEWRRLAVERGFDGLHVVQMNGVLWTPSAWERQSYADAVMEYYPNYYGGPMKSVYQITHSKRDSVQSHSFYFGTHTSWNNFPRHISDGKESVSASHPAVFEYILRKQIQRTSPGEYVFVNAWNEWGEGASVEPSVEFGYAWLNAIKRAKLSRTEIIPRAGLTSNQGNDRVCIVVRTFSGHSDEHLYNIRGMLKSLTQLEHVNWVAFLVDTGSDPFDGLASIVASFNDRRMHIASVPNSTNRGYDPVTSGYDLSDHVMNVDCKRVSPAWILVTNGDNFYSPDALNILPPHVDLVMMNFFSRWPLVNSLNVAGVSKDQCCSRFTSYTCTIATPTIGLVDLGAMIISAKSLYRKSLTFSQFTGTCKTGACQDGAFAEYTRNVLHWNYHFHSPTHCAFYHNPSYESCVMVGGIYFDSADIAKAGCYDFSNLPHGVDWSSFPMSEACLCELK